MTTRKRTKRLDEVLKMFVDWEVRNAEFLIESQRSGGLQFPEDVIKTAKQITEKNILKCKGVLSAAYLSYLDHQKTLTAKERKSPKGIIDKYNRYAEAFAGVESEEFDFNQEENWISRERNKILIEIYSLDGVPFSDMFNSEVFLEYFDKDILYCNLWKKWLIWDGRRWEKDEVNKIHQFAMSIIKEIYNRSQSCMFPDDSYIPAENVGSLENMLKIDSMIKVSSWKQQVSITPDILDRDNMIINCNNGIIDLTSGRLLNHNRSLLITKLAPVDYVEDAECPQWKNFLKTIFKKNKDLINYIQKVLGMCLTGDVSAQAIFILYGAGANGKSTFLNTISKIMGDYGTNTPTETFMLKKGNNASNDIARLNGARFVTATEGNYGERLAEAIVKRLTGNEQISARFLYGEYFEFVPTFKIFMATNHKPKISGLDHAIWRRIKLIPFEVSFNEKQQDPNLQSKLETELPGIFAWMVEGCIRWQNEGLGNPPDVAEATEEYRFEMSSIESFLQEKCLKGEHELVKASVLYEAYKQWAQTNNEHIMSMRVFGMRLSESGLDKNRISTGYHWLGINLK